MYYYSFSDIRSKAGQEIPGYELLEKVGLNGTVWLPATAELREFVKTANKQIRKQRTQAAQRFVKHKSTRIFEQELALLAVIKIRKHATFRTGC